MACVKSGVREKLLKAVQSFYIDSIACVRVRALQKTCSADDLLLVKTVTILGRRDVTR